MSAYMRPNRNSLPFSNGHHYDELPNPGNGLGTKTRRNERKRKILRYCLAPGLILVLLILWISKDAVKPPPPPEPVKEVDPFEQCESAISDANVPSAYNITALNLLNHTTYSNHLHSEKDESRWAKVISAQELMEKLERGENIGPRVLHQSWKPGPMPEHFERWSRKWRMMLDDTWLYVLWRDEDNLRLVEQHYPKYLKAYKALPREIYRADMVRNMYMHHFGGVYADLDLVPLAPLSEHLPLLKHTIPPPVPITYLGHMGEDSYEHSIPNAFMVTTNPGHPFWLNPLEFVLTHGEDPDYLAQPEGLTGPVALRSCYKDWEKTREVREGEGEFAEVRVLPNDKIYPFSWYDSPLVDHCLCRLHSKWFSEERCHWRFRGAWTITYWTHSWGF